MRRCELHTKATEKNPPFKPPLLIAEVVTKVCLKILPNFATLKTSATVCFPCNVIMLLHISVLRLRWGVLE